MSAPSRTVARARGKRGAALLRLDDTLRERRFEPSESPRAIVAIVGMSLGGVALGAGVYGQWIRAEAWRPAPWLMAAGLVLFAVYWLCGLDPDRPLRVGDLGVAIERDSRAVERVRWHQMAALVVRAGRGLELRSADGRTIVVSLARHRKAVARLLTEATERIADKVRVPESVRDALGEPSDGDGVFVSADLPQIAGQTCLASGNALTIEKDVRLCARCASAYHRSEVPKRCLACDARLR